MTDFRPTQIFASFKANPPPKKVAVKPEVDVEPKLRKDHTIEVTATGELSLLPDRCKVFVRISSSKDNVQEAKNSVTRRLDYVIQTLSNNQVKVSNPLIGSSSCYIMVEITSSIIPIYRSKQQSHYH